MDVILRSVATKNLACTLSSYEILRLRFAPAQNDSPSQIHNDGLLTFPSLAFSFVYFCASIWTFLPINCL